MFKRKWIIVTVIVLSAIALGGYFYWGRGDEMVNPDMVEGEIPVEVAPPARQAIRPADEVIETKATGNIALQQQEVVVSKIKALINTVHVKVGDKVATGDILVTFDTQNLAREVEDARFDLSKAQSELKKLTTPPEAIKVTVAEQKLLIAREELTKTKAGATKVDLQAAEADVFAAWAKYNELVAGKSNDELAGERVALRKAERELKRAQEDYDSISWRADFEIGKERAKTLESVTDSYESAKAAYNKAVAPAPEKDLRSAYVEALKAQEKLAELRQKPTRKEVAEAELKVFEAQDELDKLVDFTDSDKVADAKMEVKRKELALTEAESKLSGAELSAPFDGVVVKVEAQAGKTAEVNDKLVTIANLQLFKLTVNVAETKINQLHEGQGATITLDAVPETVFNGKVSYISPINLGSGDGTTTDSGPANYAVTVDLEIKNGAGIRSGMTAVVNFIDETLAGAWLVPTTAIQPDNSLMIYRNNEPLTVTVEPGQAQGEWTVVHSPDLQLGDEVDATLNSFLNEDPFGNGNVVVE